MAPETTGMGGTPFRRGRNPTILVRGSGRRKERRCGIKSTQPHSEQDPLANAGSEPGTKSSLPGCDGLARGFAAALSIAVPPQTTGCPRSEWFPNKNGAHSAHPWHQRPLEWGAHLSGEVGLRRSSSEEEVAEDARKGGTGSSRLNPIPSRARWPTQDLNQGRAPASQDATA